LTHGAAGLDVPLCSLARPWQAGRMQIPSSPQTSWVGAIGAVALAIASIPMVPESVRNVAGLLAAALLGGGFVLAADHRAVQRLRESGRCVTCGRPNEAPPAGAPPGPV
jgi:hypothetical protein